VIASEAISMIRFRTGRDSSGHIQDSSLFPELDLEMRDLRRQLMERAPEWFASVNTSPTFVGTEIVTPGDFWKMIRLEELVSGSGTTAQYIEVSHADALRPQGLSRLAWREEGTRIKITPPEDVAGVLGWRLTYLPLESAIINDNNDFISLPDGFEQIVVLRVCATVAIRCHDEEKADRFTAKADAMLPPLLASFGRRRGVHARPGATATRTGYYRRGGVP
jgi:hypothetical protein